MSKPRKWANKNVIYVVSVLICMLAYILITFPNFYPFPEITAYSVSKLLNLLGYSTMNYNHLVISGSNTFAISPECSGVIIFAAFIFTLQIMPFYTIIQKIYSFLLIPFIYLGNVVRVSISIAVGIKGNMTWMVLVHDAFGQLFIFFWIIILYFVWLKLINLLPKDTSGNKMYETHFT